MKTFSIVLLGCFLSVAVWAQTNPVVTIKVNGTRNKEIRVDGQAYTVSSDINSVNGSSAPIVINQLSIGQHTLDVYRTSGTRTSRSNRTYFTVRANYDLTIVVNAAGGISQTEKRIRRTGNQASYRTPVSETVFNSLVDRVEARYTNGARNTELNNIFATSGYYFTAEQAKELIGLVSTQATRLELSKTVYKSLTDPENYTVLNDLLNTQSRRNELDSYVINYNLQNPGYNSSTTNAGYSAMTDYNFSQLYTDAQNQGSNSARVSYLSNVFASSTNYFTTAQVRQLLQLANNENDKLTLAKSAYNNVVDPTNYPQLYDLFSYQSSRNELASYINSNSSSTRQAMSTSSYTSLYNDVAEEWPVSSRVSYLNNTFSNSGNYFTTSQIRQLLLLIYTDNDRLSLAKLAYDNVIDPSNYSALSNLFSTTAVRNEFDVFVRNNGSYNGTTGYRTPMLDENYTTIYDNVRYTFGLGAKMSSLTDIFNNSSYYFTTMQARQLIMLVSSESNRLTLAKLSYDNITDPENFSKIYDVFSSQSSKNELEAYVRNL